MGKRKKEELPDYTVANMDVDGMPWNSRRPWQIFPGDPSKSRKEFDVKVPEPGMENEVPDDLSAFQNPPMTKEERRGIIWLSLKASLTVGLIFGGAAFIFILFCVFVWLKLAISSHIREKGLHKQTLFTRNQPLTSAS